MRSFLDLLYHDHFPDGMVADSDKVCPRDGDNETQGRILVLFGCQYAAVDIVQPHEVTLCSVHYNLPIIGVYLGVYRLHVINSDKYCIANVYGVVLAEVAIRRRFYLL